MRSPLSVTQSAAGASPWLVLDYLQRPFNVGLFASLSFDGNLTYQVQHTPDNPNKFKGVTLSRTTTVATATFAAAHGLNVGDSIVVQGSGDANLDGTFAVASVVDATHLTYTVANTGLAADTGHAKACLMRVFPHAYLTALTAKADGNYAFPVWATRVNVTAYTAGSVTLEVVQGYARG